MVSVVHRHPEIPMLPTFPLLRRALVGADGTPVPAAVRRAPVLLRVWRAARRHAERAQRRVPYY